MKNKICIVILIVIIIGILVLGIINIIHKQNFENNERIVELFYKDVSNNFSVKFKKIKLTSNQEEKIIEFYKNTDTKTTQYLDLAFLGSIKLKFSDGNTITMDENDDCYAMYNNEYIIKISREFKNYILDII